LKSTGGRDSLGKRPASPSASPSLTVSLVSHRHRAQFTRELAGCIGPREAGPGVLGRTGVATRSTRHRRGTRPSPATASPPNVMLIGHDAPRHRPFVRFGIASDPTETGRVSLGAVPAREEALWDSPPSGVSPDVRIALKVTAGLSWSLPDSEMGRCVTPPRPCIDRSTRGLGRPPARRPELAVRPIANVVCSGRY
jgi:hypothetical protein